ncbi:MAG: type VI secretion system baseplate subunit TssK [Planctomycetota bacterium]
MPPLEPEVRWEDGLLLRPQHFQAFQRHCQGLIGQLALARSFGYGVRELKIRSASIGNWIFELEACQLVMPDGSVLIDGETAKIAPLEFKDVGAEAPTLDVWLAIPLWTMNGPNVVEENDDSGDQGRRYLGSRAEVPDENTGSNPQTIGVQRLNARLFVGQPPAAGHVTMKIAELKKVVSEGEEGRRYELSPKFVPPCLMLEASATLRSIVKDILDQVEEKNGELLGHLRGKRDLLTGESMERPETLLKLQASNAVLPVLRQLAAQSEMHPFDVYLQLTRLVGDLAIFGADWSPPKLVVYHHDDPIKAFTDLKRTVLRLLARAVDTQVERRAFELVDETARVHEVALPTAFFAEGVELLVCCETDRDGAEVHELFGAGRTVVASPEELKMVRRARIEGVPCRVDPNLHPSLADRENLVFLKLQPEGDFWPAVLESKKLALAGDAAGDQAMRFYVYATGVTSQGAN